MDKIRVAILGAGTVGTGVYKLINKQADEMIHKVGANIEIAKILVRNKNKTRDGIDSAYLTDNFDEILNDDSINIVVEVMGGIEPANTYITQALKAKKNIVTANKDLIASKGHALMELAKENGCDLLFEAAVAGAIPIIRPLKQCLAGNYISEIMGIVNGTTNFILTKMTKEGMDFDEALKIAQDLGYAEADPTADIEGYDAVRKIAILASLAKGKTVDFEEIYTEGISKITAEDFKYAKKMGRSIKLLGKCKNEDTGVVCSVAPRLLAPDHPLYNVSGVTNGILVRGNMVGDLVFIGSGAGKLPTASAVVSDVVDSVRHLNVSTTVMWKEEKLEVEDFSKSKKKFFVRTTKSKEEVEAVFGNVEYIDAGISGEIGFATEKLSEQDFDAKAEKLGNVISRIRIEG